MALVEVIRVINGIEYTFQEDEDVAKQLGLNLVDRSAPAEEQVKATPKKTSKK